MMTVRRVVEQPGQLEADEETALHARISGYVEAWHADIGKRVRAGELLATLSVPEMDQELLQKKAVVQQAEADLGHAERALDLAKANVQRSEAALKQAQAARGRAEANLERWTSEYNRGRRLVQNQSISSSEFEATQDSFKTAKAALAESVAAVELAGADREARAAELAQAEAAVRVARAKLRVAEADRDRTAALVGFAKITAPFDGVITRRQVEKGQLVQPPAGGTPGTPLFTLARTDKVRVLVDVPEAAAAYVRDGMGAAVRLPALHQRELSATVARTSWALDNRTRTLRAQVDLDNRDGLLRPGMFVSVRLTVERPGLMVPAGAVYQSPDERPYLVRVEGNRARRVFAQVGERHGDMVELLRAEVAAPGETPHWEAPTGQEEIVAANPAGYEDGQPVAPRAVAQRTEAAP